MANVHVGAPSLALLHMLTGCWISQALYVAAKLGIADLLQEGPQSYTRLAEATQTHAGALYRVLRALASVGVFVEDEAGCFRLTPLAEPLCTDTPGSLRAFALMLGAPEHWRAWEGMLHSVRTGQPAFDHVFAVPLFQYFPTHPEAARIFDDAMTSRSGPENAAIVTAYDFTAAHTLVDVGGGQGTLLASILSAHPKARGVLFDLPHVIAPVRTRMESTGQAARWACVAGDFFTAVPSRGDCYLLKKVIHDWDDERAQRILTNCRTAMADAGRLLLMEPLIPPGNAASSTRCWTCSCWCGMPAAGSGPSASTSVSWRRQVSISAASSQPDPVSASLRRYRSKWEGGVWRDVRVHHRVHSMPNKGLQRRLPAAAQARRSGSSRQGCASDGVEVSIPSIARFRR